MEFVNRNVFPFESYPEIESREQRLESPIVSESVKIPTVSINFINVKINYIETCLPYENSSEKEKILEKGVVLNTAITINESVPEIKPNKKSITIDGFALNKEQFDELLTLLNNYKMCVALDIIELRCTHLIEINIVEKPGTELTHAKPYPTNNEKRNIIREKLAECKKNKLASETMSSYASPCILISKSDGTFRLVIDYRKLNANTVRLNFPLPNIEDGIEELKLVISKGPCLV